MLAPFGPDLYAADGPTVSFYGFVYPTRMALARLADGSVWVWSPIALSGALADQVERVGPVRYLVSPNKLHHRYLREWCERWPQARLYAPPGLARKCRTLRLGGELAELAEPPWAGQIDQVAFRGSCLLEEMVFYHRRSRTALVGDLIQRHWQASATGWRGRLMRLDGLVGPNGSTPREWRWSFLSRRSARAARATLLGWQPQRLLVAHGQCATSAATEIIAAALSWI